MIRYTLIFSVLAAGLLVSCESATTNARLAQVDSLGTHLNRVREVVTGVDSAQMEARTEEIIALGEWMLNNVTDTLTSQPGIAFGDFMRCKRYYEKARNRYKSVKQELAYTEKQLTTLRSDVKNRFYTEEEFAGFFKTESAAVKKLAEAADLLENSYAGANERYLKTKPLAMAVVDSIKTVIYSSEPHR